MIPLRIYIDNLSRWSIKEHGGTVRFRFIPFIMLLLLLCSCNRGSSNIISGKVVSIQDGDTITVLMSNKTYRIRLDGIDCPEKKQAFGNVAKQFTSVQVFGRQVKVKWYEKDRYDRYLGTVFTPEGKNLNQELLKAGLAWHYKKYNKSVHLASLEDIARQQNRGLWSDKQAIPPWEFRRRR